MRYLDRWFGAEGGHFVGRALKLPFPITYDSKDSLPLNRARRITRTAGMKRNTMDSVWTRKPCASRKFRPAFKYFNLRLHVYLLSLRVESRLSRWRESNLNHLLLRSPSEAFRLD